MAQKQPFFLSHREAIDYPLYESLNVYDLTVSSPKCKKCRMLLRIVKRILGEPLSRALES